MRSLIALLGVVFTLSACAQEATGDYKEGKDYFVLEQPVRTADPSKIEVAEVFSYHCPHCLHFEALLQVWEKQQADDVDFVQTHAKWNAQMEPLSRGFYTSIALKIKDKTHMDAFKAFQVEHKPLATAEDWAEFFSAYGVDKAKAINTYNSFGVNSMVMQAEARMRSYKVSGTPEMVVEGKYRINANMTGGQGDMLKVVDFLVAKVRKERALAKK